MKQSFLFFGLIISISFSISSCGNSEKKEDTIVDEIIEKNPKAVEDYKKGKAESLKFLTGQVMAKTRGKANPQVVSQLLEEKLK